MQHNLLENFIVLADSGSFEKAAKSLFLSSTALIKQINQLEMDLNIKLFERTNKGLTLTAGGKVFYDAVRNTQNYLASTLLRAHNANAEEKRIIRMGISLLNPYHEVSNLFRFNMQNYQNFSVEVVPLGCEQNEFYGHINNLGQDVDMIPYLLGNVHFEQNCNSFCLACMPLCAAIPLMHPLNSLIKVSLADLDGETVVTLADSVNVHYAKINEQLRLKAPNARIYYVNMLDYTTSNFALQKNAIMLACAFLKDAFPMVMLHELQEKIMLPYGIYYSKTPSPEVVEMLACFRENGVSGSEEGAQWVQFSKSK